MYLCAYFREVGAVPLRQEQNSGFALLAERVRPLVNRALVKNTRQKSSLLGEIDRETIDVPYYIYKETSVYLAL